MARKEDSTKLTAEQSKYFEDALMTRWLKNSERINRQLGSKDYKPVFRFGSRVDEQLRIALLEWFHSSESTGEERGFLFVGRRALEENDIDVPSLITTAYAVEMTGGAIQFSAEGIRIDLGMAGYFINQSFPQDYSVEPIAIIHTHPTRFQNKQLEFSPEDNRWVTSFVKILGLPPVRGIYLGLAALQESDQITMEMRTAINTNTVITKTLTL